MPTEAAASTIHDHNPAFLEKPDVQQQFFLESFVFVAIQLWPPEQFFFRSAQFIGQRFVIRSIQFLQRLHATVGSA